MESKQISYNIEAEDNVTDSTVGKALNIPEKYWYTEDINPAALDVVQLRNEDAETRKQISMGVDPITAKQNGIDIAAKYRKKAEQKLISQGKPIKYS